MKVFVATSEGQGLRETDFYRCDEGELVIFPSECDFEIDGNCGCRRSMRGLDSGGTTTTFKVVNSDITREELFEKFVAYLAKSDKVYVENLERDGESYQAEIDVVLETASSLPYDAILEKRGDEIYWRRRKAEQSEVAETRTK